MKEESHKSENITWLRAAVLGANDGIVSTASIIVGVAAGHANHHHLILSGVAGLVSGAMSMAAGEYVSVSSQSDTEQADIAREKEELKTDIEYERKELAQIYVKRGLEPSLATEVAKQLMDHDAIGSHTRDELGIVSIRKARPVQASVASAAAFSIGGILPLLIVILYSGKNLTSLVVGTSLVFLIGLGVFAAHVGGANIWKGALRVGFWGAFAMAITAAIGSLFGV